MSIVAGRLVWWVDWLVGGLGCLIGLGLIMGRLPDWFGLVGGMCSLLIGLVYSVA